MRVFVPISVGGWTRLFSRWDILAILLILGLLIFLGGASRSLFEPLAELQRQPPSLDLRNLPEYAARTTLRMLIAMVLSLIFTFTYATLAGAAARHSAIGADPRLHFGHRGLFHEPRAWPGAGCGIRFHFRDFHQSGLEHGF